MHFTSALKVSAILVNVGAFVFAAIVLYDLSRRGRLAIFLQIEVYIFHVAQKYVVIFYLSVLNDEYLSYKAVIYFCFNPASIFFTAPYSESFHAAVSFYIMLR